MSYWRDQIRSAGRINDTPAKQAMRTLTVQAWLEERAYSHWPRHSEATRKLEVKYQSQLLSKQFTRAEIIYALRAEFYND